ncbi:MAG TPA: tetratricopeptide repeat protein [Pyrinomonadaceae bacterium]|jgi:protein involved in polysaccharide export with SLBB domain|nr:tetratricopeptide repeat protein [Pyrinomonadaceae bacterium]
MMKKVLAILIFLLALCLPVCAAQDQTPTQNDTVKAPEKLSNANEQPPPTTTEPKQDEQNQTGVASKVSQASSSSSDGAATGATDFYKLGLAHYESKKFKDAVDAFKRASRLKPRDADIQYNLGLAYYSSNQYREAAKAYEQAVRLKPDWADAHFRLGWMYYVLGKKDAAFDQYKILQTLSPEQARTLQRIISEPALKATANTKKESKAATKTPPQPDPKDDAKVESRLVVSDISQPAPTTNNATDKATAHSPANVPTSTATAEKEGDARPNLADTTAALTPANTSSVTPNTNASSTAATSSITGPTKTDPPAKEGGDANASVEEASLVKTYRVGVGDVLDIRLVNTPTTRSTLYTVMEGGLIEYPLAGGPMNVSGLTTEEINARLSAELKRRAVNQNSNEIFVSVRDYASHNVVISGLVNSPGMRILHREAVPLYVVLADAQPRTEASRVLIMRASGQVPVDLTDPAQMNVLVRPGDVITVSARPPQFYYLGGKIMTPGQKPFQQGMTLVQAILAAGGLERSNGDVIEISREGADGRLTTTKYKLKDIRAGKVPDPRLQPGDRIEVSK